MFKKIRAVFYSDTENIDSGFLDSIHPPFVGGVIPNHENKTLFGVEIFDTIKQACQKVHCNAVFLFVDPKNALNVVEEIIDAKLDWVVCTTANIPQEDLLEMKEKLNKNKTKMLGPNSLGFCIPKSGTLSLMPDIFQKGNVALIGKSDTLLYEAAYQLKERGLGESLVMHIGKGPVRGIGFKEGLKMAADVEDTKVCVLLSDMVGNEELECIEQIKKTPMPVIVLMAGTSFPEIKQIDASFVYDKINALKNTHVTFAKNFLEIGALCQKAIRK